MAALSLGAEGCVEVSLVELAGFGLRNVWESIASGCLSLQKCLLIWDPQPWALLLIAQCLFVLSEGPKTFWHLLVSFTMRLAQSVMALVLVYKEQRFD